MGKNKQYQVSGTRKALYYGGMALTVIGVILFVLPIFRVFFQFGASDPGDSMMRSFLRAPLGWLMIAAGQIMMKVGRGGLAGSGVLLDPEKARTDLEPFARQGGGMLSDALEEVEALKARDIIKVRCPACQALNEEQARFCSQCGQALIKES